MATSQHRCVFVGNIPYDATEEQLVQICEEVGPVVSFRLVIDRETGKPKGYGFCEYKDEETALSARRNLQGYEINGRQLRVDFAENDKGVDRNREQGRGGPGLTAFVGGPAILGDSALHQPIGLPLAMTSASIMAGALGNPQIGSMSLQQNGLPVHSGSGSDPLTQYLAKMSRNQLYEIMSEIKVMATQNKELARQLLLSSSQLPKALFQAQIMLGMVTPQVLQMPNIRQSTGSLSQTQLQDGLMEQQAAVRPPHPGQASLMPNKMHLGPMPRIPETQVSALPQKAFVNNQSSMHPLNQVPVQPRFQHPQQAQSQVLLQPTMAGQSGMATVPSVQPQSFSGMSFRPQNPPLATSNTSKQQIQTPLLQHPRPVGAANLGHNPQLFLPNANIQHSLHIHSSSSKPSVQSGMSILPGGPEMLNKDAERSASLNNDTTWPPRNKNNSNFPLGLSEQTSVAGDTFELMNRPAKLAKLEDGRSISNTMTSLNPSTAAISRSNQVFGSSSLSTNKIFSAEGLQQPEKQTPQLQLPSGVESALLQQVKSLTSEQLSSLPLEQQQQVIQLQKMLQFQSQM